MLLSAFNILCHHISFTYVYLEGSNNLPPRCTVARCHPLMLAQASCVRCANVCEREIAI